MKDELNSVPLEEVELKYPSKLHDEHSDYPLALENIKIDASMFSPFMEEHFHATDSKKLTPNLSDKERYTVHYRNLQLYMQLGMTATKLHRVLQFERVPWLKQYILLYLNLYYILLNYTYY